MDLVTDWATAKLDPGEDLRKGHSKLLRRLLAAGVVVACTLLVTSTTPAFAQESTESVSSMEIEIGPWSKLSLTMDKPISQQDADAIRKQLAPEGSAATSEQVETLGCNKEMTRADGGGSLNLRFQCRPQNGVVNWGFRMSPQTQATVVGTVAEDGLRWWRNSVEAPKASPHNEIASYIFHGTMTPVFVNDIIDYQDVFIYRHNIGTGGTARLAFAGSLGLTY